MKKTTVSLLALLLFFYGAQSAFASTTQLLGTVTTGGGGCQILTYDNTGLTGTSAHYQLYGGHFGDTSTPLSLGGTFTGLTSDIPNTPGLNDGGSILIEDGGSCATSYSDGDYWESIKYYSGASYSGLVADVGVEWNKSGSSYTTPGTLTPIVSMIYPASGGTVSDFAQWQVSWNNLPSDFTISVHYSTDSSIVSSCTDFPSGGSSGYSDCITPTPHINADYSPSFSGSIRLGGSDSVNKSITLPAGTTYYVQAVAQDTDAFGVPLAHSAVISFTVGAAGGGGVGLPPTLTCSTGDIPCYIMQALQFLFQPSADSLNNFVSLYNSYKLKPPFGYVSAVNTALSSLNDTGTSAFSLSSLPILNTQIFDPLRTAFEWLLWVGFAFVFYHRLKDIHFI